MNFQMSLDDFHNNLKNISRELVNAYGLPLNKSILYKLELDLEKDKKHNSMDDFIYRSGLEDLINKQGLFSDSDVTKILCRPNNIKYPELFPLWINVSFLCETNIYVVLHLLISTRFRKHSMLKNQELGYPPFAISMK